VRAVGGRARREEEGSRIDEIDALVKGGDYLAQAIKAELAYIASKDRSEAVGLIIAGQRGTAEWVGGSDVRSQMDIVCLGKVSRRGEMHHAAGDMGLTLPDMSTYGEGHPGVWVIAEDGGTYHVGRTFNLTEPPDLRRIATARRSSRPSPEPGLLAYLGAPYAGLRDRVPVAASAVAADAPDATYRDHGPLRDLAQAVLNGDIQADPEMTEAFRQAEDIASREDDSMSFLDRDLEDSLPDDLRGLMRKIDSKNAETRRMQEDIAKIEFPDVAADKIAEAARQRWQQIADEAEIPAAARQKLIGLLRAGTSISAASEALGQTKWTIRTWLEKLRGEGIVHVEGEKRGARWVLTEQPDDRGDQ
jgi:hypothetical protein